MQCKHGESGRLEVRDQYREATWRGSKDVWVELADLDDCKLIPVCDLDNKLDGERRRLVR